MEESWINTPKFFIFLMTALMVVAELRARIQHYRVKKLHPNTPSLFTQMGALIWYTLLAGNLIYLFSNAQ